MLSHSPRLVEICNDPNGHPVYLYYEKLLRGSGHEVIIAMENLKEGVVNEVLSDAALWIDSSMFPSSETISTTSFGSFSRSGQVFFDVASDPPRQVKFCLLCDVLLEFPEWKDIIIAELSVQDRPNLYSQIPVDPGVWSYCAMYS